MADPVSLAITVALNAAAMAATAMTKIEGPRLTDLSVTVADYGTTLNYIHGRRRVEVPVFFAEPILEVKKRRKTKGGKYNEYTYYGTWAVAVADNELESYRRIWFDRHLVYQNSAETFESIFALADGYEISNSVQFFYGSQDQMPHERMVATIEARDGIGSCPAYRGVSYILFIDIPLEKLGNRYPQVSVEAITSATPVYPFESYPIHDSNLARLWGATFSSDYTRFMWSSSSYFETWNVPDRTRVRAGFLATGILFQSVLGLYNDGSFLACTFNDVLRFNADGSGGSVFYDPPFFPGGVRVLADNNGVEHWVAWPSTGFDQKFAIDGVVFDLNDYFPSSFVSWAFTDAEGSIWVVAAANGNAATTVYFLRALPASGATGPSTVTVTGLNNLGPLGPSFHYSVALHYKDENLDQFVFAYEGHLYAADRFTGAVLIDNATPPFDAFNTDNQFAAVKAGDSSIWLGVFGISQISLADFSTIRTINTNLWTTESCDGIIYDRINNALICSPLPGPIITWRFLDRFDDNGVTLRSIIEQISVRSGIHPDDVDASLCTQIVAGYSWTQGSGKDIIGPLLDLYDVDARPHDFGIEFLPRGNAVQGNIENIEFAVSSEDDARFAVNITSDSDLPRRLFFSFADIDADQQPNTATPQRRADAIDGARELSIDMTTLALVPSEAADLSNRMFRRIWFSREKAEFGLTAQRLGMEPGDVFNIGFDGNFITMRLAQMSIGAAGIIATKWQRDHPNLALLPGMEGAPALGRPVSVIFNPGPSQGFVLDIPLLDDSQDQTTPFVYIAAGPLDEADFYSGTDFSYSDTSLIADFASGWDAITPSQTCTHGYMLTPLTDALSSIIDYGSAIQVQILNGELQSVTETQILADSSLNLALIGRELIQFTSATLIGAKTYELTGLVRGARGTEAQTSSHDYIEQFLLLDSNLKKHNLGASEIGDTDYYIPASLGLNPDIADVIEINFAAVANKPYSPAHLDASLDDYSGEWTISWIRRSRIGGSTVNGQNVPLGETSESYKLQILDGGGTVLRTIEQSSNSYVYALASQIADFGAPAASFSYRVAQQSPMLGIDGFFSNGQAIS